MSNRTHVSQYFPWPILFGPFLFGRIRDTDAKLAYRIYVRYKSLLGANPFKCKGCLGKICKSIYFLNYKPDMSCCWAKVSLNMIHCWILLNFNWFFLFPISSMSLTLRFLFSWIIQYMFCFVFLYFSLDFFNVFTLCSLSCAIRYVIHHI